METCLFFGGENLCEGRDFFLYIELREKLFSKSRRKPFFPPPLAVGKCRDGFAKGRS